MKIYPLPKKIFIIAFCCLLFSGELQARKLNLKFGFFNVSAKTSSSSGNLNAVGAYNVSLHQEIQDNLEAVIGYSVLMSKTIGGDLGFGLDIGMNYFPFSRLRPQKTELGNASVYINELWRPYVGLNFSERRFQSVEANYAGFGISLGTERQLEQNDYSLVFEFKYTSFEGTSSATANEIILFTGISMPF